MQPTESSQLNSTMLRVFLWLALLSLTEHGGTDARVLEPGLSCMMSRVLQSGVPLARAKIFEKRMISAGLTEDLLRRTPDVVLNVLLNASTAESRGIQQCIARTSELCRSYAPCQNGGECQLTSSKKSYACSCHADFTGTYCQTPHPAPVDEFRILQKEVKSLKAKLQSVTSGCSRPVLGYRFKNVHGRRNQADKAQLDSITFQKKRQTTYVRLSYSANIRTLGSHAANRWYFLIDGNECAVPSKIDITIYTNGDAGNHHHPSYLTGICQATTGGVIGKGSHVISVHVGKELHHPLGDAFSGWGSTSFLEVQEICPPF